MSEPVSQQQFYDEMKKTRDDLRLIIEAGFDKLTARLDGHEKDDREVERRVTSLELAKENDRQDAHRRSTWIGILAAGSFNGLIEAVKFFFQVMKR